jgi:uncharacterized protein YqgC (DUF456 family)
VEFGFFSAALVLVVIGVIGSVMPLLPGLPPVLAGAYLYALGTEDKRPEDADTIQTVQALAP